MNLQKYQFMPLLKIMDFGGDRTMPDERRCTIF
jgi:hypothetical protein